MIKSIYAKQDDIPKEYLPLFAEKNGQWELSGVEGIYTKASIERIEGSLVKERTDHKETKSKLTAWGTLDPKEVIPKLDKFPELEALAEGKDMNDEKIEKIVESRLATKMGPVTRELEELKTTNSTLVNENEGFKTGDRKRTIKDNILEAALKSKLIPTAVEDAVMQAQSVFQIDEAGKVRTKDNVGVTPGIDADVWLTEMQKTRPHWWPASSGGGGKGSQNNGGMANNPWLKDHWNLTEQGKIINTEGREKADQLAKSANSKVGAMRPTEEK